MRYTESARYRPGTFIAPLWLAFLSARPFDARDIHSLLSSFPSNFANEHSLGYITLIRVREREKERERESRLLCGSIQNARDKKPLLSAQTHGKVKTLQLSKLKCSDVTRLPFGRTECGIFRNCTDNKSAESSS